MSANPNENIRVARLTRKEKLRAKDQPLESRQQEEEEKGDDGLDLIEEVDVLGKCNPDWQEQTLDKKRTWKEKQSAMDTLNQDLNLPKVKAGDSSGVVRVVK